MMITSDYGYQHINWMHSALENEPFEHRGTLTSQLLNLRLTIGVNDWWDISFEPSFVKRCMDWNVDDESVHHRTECSNTNYYNSNGDLQVRGGYLGDFKLKGRYLFKNTGKGFGNRIFFEGGLIIPSRNTLILDPYFLEHDPDPGEEDHRHFSVSDGTYKLLAGVEYFEKRKFYPVFWGVVYNMQFPLKENDYGFLSSNNYSLSFLMLSGPPNKERMGKFKLSSIGFGLSIMHSDYSKWHGITAPNSKSTAITPNLSFVIGSMDYGTFGLSLNVSDIDAFNSGDTGVDSNFKQKASVFGFSISYRKNLDKIIDKLYWDK